MSVAEEIGAGDMMVDADLGATEAAKILLSLIVQAPSRDEVTYVELAKRLKRHGFAETEASITNKLKRGTFSATFFLACLAALELEGVALDEI